MEHFSDGWAEALMYLYEIGSFVDLNGTVPYYPWADGVAELFLHLAGEAELDSALHCLKSTNLR